MIYGNVVGGNGAEKSYILECIDGTQVIGVMVDKETIFNAKAKDIKAGKFAATENGIIEGTNTINYRTEQGVVYISPGDNFKIVRSDFDMYDYTKLQCLISPFNTLIDSSVAVDKFVIDDKVYAFGSTDPLSTVTKNSETKSINLNIINNTENTYVIRFFMYKEEEN